MVLNFFPCLVKDSKAEAESKEKYGVWDPYAGIDYNITSCRLQHIYILPYARFDLNPRPEATLTLCQSRP
jgi:hypothetical protein